LQKDSLKRLVTVGRKIAWNSLNVIGHNCGQNLFWWQTSWKTDHRNLSQEKEKCENFYRVFFTENRLGLGKKKQKQGCNVLLIIGRIFALKWFFPTLPLLLLFPLSESKHETQNKNQSKQKISFYIKTKCQKSFKIS